MAEAAKVSTRKKKGDGPIAVSYIDAENKASNRVTATVDSIQIGSKDGKQKQGFAINSLPPAIVKQLAAMALKSEMIRFVNNGVDDTGSNIVTLANQKFASIKEGKLFQRSEQGKGAQGRQFDFEFYVNVMKRTAELKNKKNSKIALASAKQLAAVKTLLESKTPKDRTVQIKTWDKDPVFKLASMQLKAEAAAAAAKDGVGEVDALAGLI